MNNSNQNLIDSLNTMQDRALTHKKTSDRYQIVSTSDLITKVNSVLDVNGMPIASQKLIKANKALVGSSHAVEFTLDRQMKILGDDIKPRIIVVNSYNGEKALTVLCGVFRLVCFNGLVIGSTLYRERVIHVKGETLEGKLAALESRVNEALHWIDGKLQNTVSEFLSIETPIATQLRIVEGLGLSKRLNEKLTFAFQNPKTLRLADQGQNAWCTYNVINEAIDRSTRSELARLNKNVSLMDNVRDLALNAEFKRVA
jgi:hypothetical protein